MLPEWEQTLAVPSKCGRKKESQSESLRCCTVLSRATTVFVKAARRREYISERKRSGLPARETKFGEYSLCQSESSAKS